MREFPAPRKRGAQPGNRNAVKTGLHAAATREFRRAMWLRLRRLEAAIAMARQAVAMSGPSRIHHFRKGAHQHKQDG
jgi:hypothetical protein